MIAVNAAVVENFHFWIKKTIWWGVCQFSFKLVIFAAILTTFSLQVMHRDQGLPKDYKHSILSYKQWLRAVWSPSPSDLRLWSVLPKSVNFFPCNKYHSFTIIFLSSGKSHKLPFLTTTTTNSIWEVWTVMKFGCRKATCLCSKVKLTSSEVFHQKEQFSVVGRGISKFYYKGPTIWVPLWCAREHKKVETNIRCQKTLLCPLNNCAAHTSCT